MNKDFYFGYFCSLVFQQIYMDMNGKELYLKKASENWVNTNIWIWFGVFFIGFCFYMYAKFKEDELIIENLKNKNF